jgi:hypothetical protein
MIAQNSANGIAAIFIPVPATQIIEQQSIAVPNSS